MNDPLKHACQRLAGEGIEVSVVERDGVRYANVHATDHSDPYTWLRVVREFLAIKYCVQVR